MANALTLLRIFLILPFAAAMFAPGEPAQWTALFLFVLAGATDLFDGMIARARNETSKLGATLDPIADKMLATAALFLLVMTGELYGIHILAALIILLREVWVAGLREALAGRSVLAVTALAKWKTAAQFAAIALLLVPLGGTVLMLGHVMLWIAAGLSIATGYAYTSAALPHLRKPDGAV